MSAQPSANPLTRYAYLAAGWCCVALAFAGAFLPLLPTTPFLLPASYCFLRSSPRLHAWLRSSRTFGPFLRDWEELGGVRPGVKVLAVTVVVMTVALSLWSGRLPPFAQWLLPPLALVGIVVVLRLKTVRPDPGGRNVSAESRRGEIAGEARAGEAP
jgi:uncharacterized membrane protein YbaN (DUF454 family)